MPTFEIELLYKGLVGGVDEAGRGPWAGPVVAGVAVFLEPPPSHLFNCIEDSKKILKAKRELIYGIFKVGIFSLWSWGGFC